MKILDIGEVIKHSGLPASTLRYYEEKGLIHSAGRQGLRRLFHENVLEQLALIALGRHSGFSLDEILNMFGADKKLDIDRELLTQKAEELDQKISQLSAMRDGLRHAAKCQAPSHLECPQFRRYLNIANKSRVSK
ncbi:MAG: helix-turn-helix domain-containing protein [Hyphomicrobiales bacterium]